MHWPTTSGVFWLSVLYFTAGTAFSYEAFSPVLKPLYGINPPNGWREYTFADVPPAAGTVSISIYACADLTESDEFIRIIALGGKDFGDLFTGNSGTGCSGDCDTAYVNMTAGEWNAARSSSAGGIGGVEFEATPSIAVTNICCSDTCSSSGPGGSSECCPNQCSPIPCYTGSIQYYITYTHSGCWPACSGGEVCCGSTCQQCCTPADCNDGVACTSDSCISGSCVFTPVDANCPDDGLFCNGNEVCDAVLDCISTGDPCVGIGYCNESTDTCDECLEHAHCQDGLFCNGVETCAGSQCQPGPGDPCDPGLICDEDNDACLTPCTDVADCDDGDPCSTDDCVGGFCEFANAPNGTPCDTGLWCSNGNDLCNGGVCVGHGNRCSPAQFCNEPMDRCDPDDTDICKGETLTTICQEYCLSTPPEPVLRRFGDTPPPDDCPKSYLFENVPYVDTPVLLRTLAFGHFANSESKSYSVSLQPVGTLVSSLYYDHTGNCMTGPSIERFLEISPEDWNTAIDEVLVSGAGNVRFDMSAVGVPCGGCLAGEDVNAGVYVQVTFVAADDDCNDNGILDTCDIAAGTSTDCDGNGVPDECEGLGVEAPTPAPLEAGYAKNRYLSFVPGNAGAQTAFRITFTSLPPPYDTWNGLEMWVQEPTTYCENAGKVLPPCPDAEPQIHWTGATLGCEPYWRDWTTFGVVHVFHEGTVPGATYNIHAIHEGCDVANESHFSAPLTIDTSIWGDIVWKLIEPCPFSPPDGNVDIPGDVTAVLEKFKNLKPPTILCPAVIKVRADLDWETPNRRIDISDVTFCLDAFHGLWDPPYPPPAFPDPSPPPCGGASMGQGR